MELSCNGYGAQGENCLIYGGFKERLAGGKFQWRSSFALVQFGKRMSDVTIHVTVKYVPHSISEFSKFPYVWREMIWSNVGKLGLNYFIL